MGEIVTFYSYKGGVGRTMALANVALLLARWGYKTLMVDWDLEASGLEYFFKQDLSEKDHVGFLDLKQVAQKEGIIDLLTSPTSKPAWLKHVVDIFDKITDSQVVLHLLTAGKRDEDYFKRVIALDLDSFYLEQNGGDFIEQLRNEWKEKYDFVLVDSRTGITDIGGICTIQLPDILVLLSTTTQQSLEGIIDVFQKANQGRQKLPFDRLKLLSVPILSRFDLTPEFTLSQEWKDKFSTEVTEMYKDWLPKTVEPRDFIEKTKIPYRPYFSFGEKLAVVEEGTIDPTGLGYAYETLAALIANRLETVEQLVNSRDELIRATIKTKPHTTKYTVFVSYARKDQDFALKLVQDLRREGADIWLDQLDIPTGARWDDQIQAALEKCSYFLVVLSPVSVASQNVKDEIGLALDNNKTIMPVLYQDVTIPLRLRRFQYIDFREDYQTALNKLLQVLPYTPETADQKRVLLDKEKLEARFSWIQAFPKPRSFVQNSQISALLKGYDLFPASQAEQELDFLFGEVGGFWSGHPLYAAISGSLAPQVILAEWGGGKTAWAYALGQIGDVEGNPLPGTLPLLLSGENLAFTDIQERLAESLLNFVLANPAKWTGLSQAERKFLQELWVSSLGTERTKIRLSQLSDIEQKLSEVVEVSQAKPLNQTQWLWQVQECLRLLGFERAVLAVDLNLPDRRSLEFWQQSLLGWAYHSLIIKLFLPQSPEELSGRFDPLRLTWREEQLDQLSRWRFDSLARVAGIRTRLEFLFEEGLYSEFLTQARGNPGRLARLWRYAFEDHLENYPDRAILSAENLARAVERVP